MSKNFTLQYFLKFGLPILLLLIIIIGLAWIGSTHEKEIHVVNNYNTFKSKLSISLLKAHKFALKHHATVIICPISTQDGICGSNKNWEDGFIVYKKTKISDSNRLPENSIINSYHLNISSQVTTKISKMDMQPNGTLAQQYQFIMKSKNGGDFPYQMTIEKNLYIYTKLLSND